MGPKGFDAAHGHAKAGEHGVAWFERAVAALGLTDRVIEVAAGLGGSEAPVHRVTAVGGRVWALRARPPEQTEAITREAANAQLGASLGVAPRVLGLYCGPEVACLLTEWVPGQPLADVLAAEPERILAWGRAMGRFLASVHQAAQRHAGLATLDAGWARPHSDEESRRLEQLPPCHVSTLVHLDFHPLNVVASGGGVAAAVDWMNAGAGDARLDVARTAAGLALDGPNYDAAWERWIPPLLAALADGYEASAGPLEEMAPFMRWAGEATLRDLRLKRTPAQVAQMQATARRWEHAPWAAYPRHIWALGAAVVWRPGSSPAEPTRLHLVRRAPQSSRSWGGSESPPPSGVPRPFGPWTPGTGDALPGRQYRAVGVPSSVRSTTFDSTNVE